jgi:hypothetical protein
MVTVRASGCSVLGPASPESGEQEGTAQLASPARVRYSDKAQRSVCMAERPNGLIKVRSVIGNAGNRSSVRAHAGTIETALAAKM